MKPRKPKGPPRLGPQCTYGAVFRVIAYFALITAGCFLIAALEHIPGIIEWLWFVMCMELILGGLAAAVGQIRHRWTGEFIGLPLLYSAMAGFGALQGNLAHWSLTTIPSVAILWAFALLLFTRWRDVHNYYDIARRAAVKHRTKGEPRA